MGQTGAVECTWENSGDAPVSNPRESLHHGHCSRPWREHAPARAEQLPWRPAALGWNLVQPGAKLGGLDELIKFREGLCLSPIKPLFLRVLSTAR